MTKINNIIVENAEVRYMNLSGFKTEIKPEGYRSFNLIIRDEETAKKLIEDGWNIKKVEYEGDNDTQLYYKLEVCVRFDRIAPNIYMIANNVATKLDETTVGQLDDAEFENIDLAISPSYWSNTRGSGIKAYLREGWFTLKVGPFDDKYAYLFNHE